MAGTEPGPERTRPGIAEWLCGGAADASVALITPSWGAMTRGRLHAALDELQERLFAEDLAGRRLALVMPDDEVTALTALAAMAAGTCIPLNPATTAAELDGLLERANPDAVLVHADTPESILAALRDRRRPVARIRMDEPDVASVEWLSREAFRRPPASETETCLVLHTSGSTGTPKRVPITPARLRHATDNLRDSLQLGPEDRCLNMMPLCHLGGLVDLLLVPLATGGSVILGGPFNAARFHHHLDADEPSWTQLVPTMLRAALDEAPPGAGFGRLRFLRAVSSPLDETLRAKAEARFRAPVIAMYGMSEATGQITSNGLAPGERRPESVGRPRGAEVRIVDPQGRAAPVNGEGEILIRGPGVIADYEEPTPDTLTDGWFHTGDVGRLDEEGFLFLTGRTKEMINRGGEKITPLEIDRAAEAHPGVKEAAAFALPHPSLGEHVGLAVVTLSGTDPADTELQRFLADRLAPHKRPARIIRLEALPRATGGKLQRGALTERFRAEAEPAERRPPETESEQLLAHLWRSLLGLDKVAAGDHFFDRGGDSLKTAALVHQIERSTGKRLPPAALYEAPTLEGLAARLDAVEAEPPEPEESETPPGGLPADIRHGLEAYLAAWPGARQRADALLIGRHIEGERLPLFWCVNSREELDPLSDALGPDQPVYGMRTLCRVPGRKPQHNPPLAGLYADELEHLQPEGPIVLGGFCEGGRIALEMARLLRERGRDVARLILQDEFVPRPYDGPVSLYMCRPGSQIWARDFPRPERAWPRFYLGALHIEHLEATHRNCYESPAVEDFARRLRRETDNAHDESLPAPADATRGLLDSGVHAAELSARPPTVLRAGQCCTLRVRVRNIGTAPWAPTEESGLVVGARWLTQGKRRRGLAGHAILREVVKPGFSVVVDLPVQVPERSTTRYLDIDMVEDGVCWFQDRGSESLRKWVLILAPLSAGTEQER